MFAGNSRHDPVLLTEGTPRVSPGPLGHAPIVKGVTTLTPNNDHRRVRVITLILCYRLQKFGKFTI